MPEVTDLAGFYEESLERAFEQPARLNFTLQGVRADDPPLDTDLIWTYTVNGVILLKGYLRILEESLSPDGDYQSYTLTDRLKDVERELLLIDNTARFALNPDNPGDVGFFGNLDELITQIVGTSTIITGIEGSIPPDILTEKNIEIEGRGIAEVINELLRFAPYLRYYYNSNTDKLKFKDIDNPDIKAVHLSKFLTHWRSRVNSPAGTPPYADLVEVNLTTDKTDCYQKVRLEGFGVFQEVTKELLADWHCDKTEPFFPEDFRDPCMRDDFAKKFKLPPDSIPAEFGFDDDGKAKPGQLLKLEAYIPARNTGQCIAQNTTDPGSPASADELKTLDTLPEDAEMAVDGSDPIRGTVCTDESGTDNAWLWTDFRWVPIGEVEVPTPDENGDYIIRTTDRMMSMLNVWSPNSPSSMKIPDNPRITPWKLRATYFEKLGNLVEERDGGCPNGTTFPRVNRDWVTVTRIVDGETVVIRDDQPQMSDMADALFDQISTPKTSGTIRIYLHLIDPTGTLEGAIKVSPFGGVNPGNNGVVFDLGDAVNIAYDATETDYGIGIIPDYTGPGGDTEWDELEITIMGMTFNRREQSLILQVANTPFIVGDKLVEGLQR